MQRAARGNEGRKETIRELQQGQSSDGELWETLTARVSHRSFAGENKEKDEEKRGTKGAKDQAKGDKQRKRQVRRQSQREKGQNETREE